MNRKLIILTILPIILIACLVSGCSGSFVKEATSYELYSGTVEVSGLSTHAINSNLNAGDKISIDIQSGHGIDLYILDKNNYDKFIDNNDFLYNERYQSIVEQNGISFTVPSDGQYYFTLSNRNHLTATQVYMKIRQGLV